MKKKLFAMFSILCIMSMSSMALAEETQYIQKRGDLYKFMDNHNGTELELQQDLEYMCDNAEFRSWYVRYGWTIVGFGSRDITRGWMDGWTKVTCKTQKERTYGGYTWSSIWSAYYKYTDEGKEVRVSGYYPNGRNTGLKAISPIPTN